MTLTVEFRVKHNPGTDEHLDAILENFFRPKGITYQNRVITLGAENVSRE